MRTSLSVLSGLALVATACLSPGGQAADPRLIEKRQSNGYNQPNSWLTTIPGSNLGEPLNVIISSQSSPEVLSDDGLASYLSSLFYSPNNCLGFTLGDKQAADLNDGQGTVNQTALYRYNFNMGTITCAESVNGGPHVRYWKQTTTGAIFLAASIEMSSLKNHDIVADGYDNGRDWFVGNATNSSGTTSPQDASHYKATSTNVQASINDASVNHGISTDGNVAVLTVTRTKAGNGTNPTASSSSSQSTGGSSSDAHSDAMHSGSWLLLACMAMCTAMITTPSALAFSVEEQAGVPRRASNRGSSTRAASRRSAKSSDPAVAEGQKLSNSTDPDPLPADSSLFTKAPTAPIDAKLRSRINTVSPFAQAPYCHSVQKGTWGGAGCGDACASVPGQVDVLWTAGDGDLDPHRLLVYVHKTKTLVLSVEGSNLEKLLSTIDDVAFIPLPALGPVTGAFYKYNTDSDKHHNIIADVVDPVVTGVVNGLATVHGGFYSTWARLYPQALSHVRSALKKYEVTHLISTGHSLGAAVATLDALALTYNLNGSIPIEHIGFGSPRVFNPIGAALADEVVQNPNAEFTYHHVHHDRDPVPHLGPLILGFQHSFHEVFLPNDNGTAVNCPGRENLNCSLGRKQLDFDDHKGPYLNRILGRTGEGGADSDCYLTRSGPN